MFLNCGLEWFRLFASFCFREYYSQNACPTFLYTDIQTSKIKWRTGHNKEVIRLLHNDGMSMQLYQKYAMIVKLQCYFLWFTCLYIYK